MTLVGLRLTALVRPRAQRFLTQCHAPAGPRPGPDSVHRTNGCATTRHPSTACLSLCGGDSGPDPDSEAAIALGLYLSSDSGTKPQ